MEIIVLSLVVGIYLAHIDRQERKRLFPPSHCAMCKKAIHYTGPNGKYVHDDDRKQIQWREGPPGVFVRHFALPSSEPWQFASDD